MKYSSNVTSVTSSGTQTTGVFSFGQIQLTAPNVNVPAVATPTPEPAPFRRRRVRVIQEVAIV